ncbi:IclR family transcriptional regulator [Nocardia brasiliensis]|uniref:Pectin degradation repressor protein kdgR n=1 Tax=Nocardia brasiliensis (strain ATCC 700358 / HUJEG-1) TaxID=1133849 RepID=K0F0C3_NOCB7|nr:IclR family transcriptional regulator [Nocardia brasiliensis]AFU02615.1 pectin degradation repressor protein kdgR [Nocardia brasiliensis ATCC 700358]OCF84743.1 hypothetical protein AW168_39665 [Nocardia brasiliensis]
MPEQPEGLVARSARLLDLLGDQVEPVSPADLARRAELPKTTVWRLIRVLCANGLIEQQGPGYVVGQRLVRIAVPPPENRDLLRAAAVPFLVDLHVHTGATVSLGVLAGSQVRYTERIYGHAAARTPSFGQTFAPVHCTAIGKVLLAFALDQPADLLRAKSFDQMTSRTITDGAELKAHLARARSTGIATSDEEFTRGVRCVATPVMDRRRRPVAAIAIGDTVARFDIDTACALIRRTAFAVSVALRTGTHSGRTEPITRAHRYR